MRTFLLCGALSLIGLFACVDANAPGPELEPEPPAEDLRPADPTAITEALPASTEFVICCIDFTCPIDEYSSTGCRTGAGPSVAEAYADCNNSCAVQCSSSGLYCQ